MNRRNVELALATHTMPSQWEAEDDRTIATAMAVLEEMRKRKR